MRWGGGVGQQDRFAGMGVVDQARQVRFGLMDVHDARRLHRATPGWLLV